MFDYNGIYIILTSNNLRLYVLKYKHFKDLATWLSTNIYIIDYLFTDSEESAFFIYIKNRGFHIDYQTD